MASVAAAGVTMRVFGCEDVVVVVRVVDAVLVPPPVPSDLKLDEEVTDVPLVAAPDTIEDILARFWCALPFAVVVVAVVLVALFVRLLLIVSALLGAED